MLLGEEILGVFDNRDTKPGTFVKVVKRTDGVYRVEIPANEGVQLAEVLKKHAIEVDRHELRNGIQTKISERDLKQYGAK